MTLLQPTLSDPKRRDAATARVEELLRILGEDGQHGPSTPFAKRYAFMNEIAQARTGEALSKRPVSEFPFAGLPGARSPQVLRGNQRW